MLRFSHRPIRAVLGLLVFVALFSGCRRGQGPTGTSPWFPHSKHVTDQGLACDVCHAAAANSTLAADNNLPRVEVCLGCHDAGDAACPVCSQDKTRTVAGTYRGRNLVFPHKTHLAKDLACPACHAVTEAGREAAATGGYHASAFFPKMEFCTNCHEEKPCSRCHIHTDDKAFRPKTHDAFWRDKHALSTRTEKAQCNGCHKDAWCQECHQGDIPTRVHEPSFRLTHGLEARLRPVSCDRCHKQNFCRSCHRSVPRG